ncbi:hypothetical protein LOK49_Contig140G00003 [Camellia lanceoleosa]|nr:hypothetical protein LOK49_Contig140G00003 [Camellia lanceoleosa]
MADGQNPSRINTFSAEEVKEIGEMKTAKQENLGQFSTRKFFVFAGGGGMWDFAEEENGGEADEDQQTWMSKRGSANVDIKERLDFSNHICWID